MSPLGRCQPVDMDLQLIILTGELVIAHRLGVRSIRCTRGALENAVGNYIDNKCTSGLAIPLRPQRSH